MPPRKRSSSTPSSNSTKKAKKSSRSLGPFTFALPGGASDDESTDQALSLVQHSPLLLSSVQLLTCCLKDLLATYKEKAGCSLSLTPASIAVDSLERAISDLAEVDSDMSPTLVQLLVLLTAHLSVDITTHGLARAKLRPADLLYGDDVAAKRAARGSFPAAFRVRVSNWQAALALAILGRPEVFGVVYRPDKEEEEPKSRRSSNRDGEDGESGADEASERSEYEYDADRDGDEAANTADEARIDASRLGFTYDAPPECRLQRDDVDALLQGNYCAVAVTSRVAMLYGLCLALSEESPILHDTLGNVNRLDESRMLPVGYDRIGRSYWHFEPSSKRLYLLDAPEDVSVSSPLEGLSPSHRLKAVARIRPSLLPPPPPEPSEPKMTILAQSSASWEEMLQVMAKHKASGEDERALVSVLRDELWPTLEAAAAAAERAAARAARFAAMPRKRSSRLVMKELEAEARAAEKREEEERAKAEAAQRAKERRASGAADDRAVRRSDRSLTAASSAALDSSSGKLSSYELGRLHDAELIKAYGGRDEEEKAAAAEEIAKGRAARAARRRLGAPVSTMPLPSRRADGATPSTEQEVGVDSWVQCSTCNKWRRVRDAGVAMALAAADEDAEWFCAMNTWDPALASCDVPEEVVVVPAPPPSAPTAPAKSHKKKKKKKPTVASMARAAAAAKASSTGAASTTSAPAGSSSSTYATPSSSSSSSSGSSSSAAGLSLSGAQAAPASSQPGVEAMSTNASRSSPSPYQPGQAAGAPGAEPEERALPPPPKVLIPYPLPQLDPPSNAPSSPDLNPYTESPSVTASGKRVGRPRGTGKRQRAALAVKAQQVMEHRAPAAFARAAVGAGVSGMPAQCAPVQCRSCAKWLALVGPPDAVASLLSGVRERETAAMLYGEGSEALACCLEELDAEEAGYLAAHATADKAARGEALTNLLVDVGPFLRPGYPGPFVCHHCSDPTPLAEGTVICEANPSFNETLAFQARMEALSHRFSVRHAAELADAATAKARAKAEAKRAAAAATRAEREAGAAQSVASSAGAGCDESDYDDDDDDDDDDDGGVRGGYSDMGQFQQPGQLQYQQYGHAVPAYGQPPMHMGMPQPYGVPPQAYHALAATPYGYAQPYPYGTPMATVPGYPAPQYAAAPMQQVPQQVDQQPQLHQQQQQFQPQQQPPSPPPPPPPQPPAPLPPSFQHS